MPSVVLPFTVVKDFVDPFVPAVVVSTVGEPRTAFGKIVRLLPDESYHVREGAL